MWERDVKGAYTFVCQDDFDRMLLNGLTDLQIRERRSVFFLAWVYDSRKGD